jgi:hypothetical protein
VPADPDRDSVPERRIFLKQRSKERDLPDLFAGENKQEEIRKQEAQEQLPRKSYARRFRL